MNEWKSAKLSLNQIYGGKHKNSQVGQSKCCVKSFNRAKQTSSLYGKHMDNIEESNVQINKKESLSMTKINLGRFRK